jgi:hypothetical protein
MNTVERVWSRVRTTAETLSAKGEHLSRRQALELVAVIVQEESVEPPPPAAVELLTRELLDLIAS